MTRAASPHPTERFSNRVTDYVKYRPTYPVEVLQHLAESIGLLPGKIVADVGSGTGIFTKLLLDNGNIVYAVEPNSAMRKAAEEWLGGQDRFKSVAGSAEDTTLGDHSVDFVTCAQAFHWFDVDKTKTEFARILRPNGYVILLWNNRLDRDSPFLEAYEELLMDFGTDYAEVRHDSTKKKHAIEEFFGGNYQTYCCQNEQLLDYEGLKGRLLSSSYAPAPGHPNHEPMLAALATLYERFQKNDTVSILYETKVYFGRPSV